MDVRAEQRKEIERRKKAGIKARSLKQGKPKL